jgi:hypothetical protein
MKLYRVTVEHSFFMLAEDDDDAARISSFVARESISLDPEIDLVTEQAVSSLDAVPKVWRDSIPFGHNAKELTCEEFFQRAAQGE